MPFCIDLPDIGNGVPSDDIGRQVASNDALHKWEILHWFWSLADAVAEAGAFILVDICCSVQDVGPELVR